jgi:hypothetical protein
MTSLLAACLIALAGCSSNPYPLNPARKMERPAEAAHWTAWFAYEIDGCEDAYGGGWSSSSVTTREATTTLSLKNQPFAFQWQDYDGPTMIHSFTLRESGTAMVTRMSRYEQVANGETVLMPEYIRADFQPSKDEQAAIRRAIQAADVGNAPQSFSRNDIYDGLQWQMYLRVGDKTKYVGFSNAVPERFRDLMVTIFRDICAKHAVEIDKAELTKGFAEFSGDDVFCR